MQQLGKLKYLPFVKILKMYLSCQIKSKDSFYCTVVPLLFVQHGESDTNYLVTAWRKAIQIIQLHHEQTAIQNNVIIFRQNKVRSNKIMKIFQSSMVGCRNIFSHHVVALYTLNTWTTITGSGFRTHVQILFTTILTLFTDKRDFILYFL